MRKALYLLLLLPIGAWCQQPVNSSPPPCAVPFILTATGSSTAFDNRLKACDNWTVSYSPYHASVVSLTMQAAPDAGNTPGTWAAFGSTLTAIACTSGVCPSTTQAGTPAWIRVTATLTLTAGGFVQGTVIGTQPGAAISATIPGTVTALQGTIPWAISGPVTQGTIPWVVSGTLTPGPSQGTVYYDSTVTQVPNTLTALTASTTWVQNIFCSYVGAAPGGTTILIEDTAGDVYVPTVTLLQNQFMNVAFGGSGQKFVGIKWQAGASSVMNCQILGSQ